MGWFYLQDGQTRGPLELEALIEGLLAAPEPGNVSVWREGLPEWAPAAGVPELAGELRAAGAFFYLLDGSQHGPLTPEQITSLLRSQRLPGDAAVWRRGFAEWRPAASVPELASAVPSPAVPPPPLARPAASRAAAVSRDAVAVDAGPGTTGEPFTAHGKFRKVRLLPIARHGQYRGEGFVDVSDAGIRVSGRHVYPLGARFGFGLLSFVTCLIVTVGQFAPGFLLIYLFAEYVILKREEVSASWGDIRRYVGDPRRKLVAIDFQQEQTCTPIVLRSDEWRRVLDALRARVPHADGALVVIPAASPGKALWVSSWVFIGWYALFLLGTTLILAMALSLSGNTEGIPAIQSGALRALVWLALFAAPAVPAAFMARRDFTRRRQDRRPYGAG